MMKQFLGTMACAALLLTGCQQPEMEADTGADTASMDSLMTAYEQAWETQDAAALDGILASGFTRSVNGADSYGVDSLKEAVTSSGGIQNVSIELGDAVYADDNAAVSWTLTGTMGGQSISTAGASFVTFADGKIASERAFLDTAPMMQVQMQMGEGGEMPSDTTSM